MNNEKPIKIIAAWFLFILSFAFPPALLITVPYLIWVFVSIARRAVYLRRSRDAFIVETQIQYIGRLFKGGKS